MLERCNIDHAVILQTLVTSMSQRCCSDVASMLHQQASMLHEEASMFACKQRCCMSSNVASMLHEQAAMLHRCLHASSDVETVFVAMLSTRGKDGGGNPARIFWRISYFPY